MRTYAPVKKKGKAEANPLNVSKIKTHCAVTAEAFAPVIIRMVSRSRSLYNDTNASTLLHECSQHRLITLNRSHKFLPYRSQCRRRSTLSAHALACSPQLLDQASASTLAQTLPCASASLSWHCRDTAGGTGRAADRHPGSKVRQRRKH